jgi:hypothetical protein
VAPVGNDGVALAPVGCGGALVNAENVTLASAARACGGIVSVISAPVSVIVPPAAALTCCVTVAVAAVCPVPVDPGIDGGPAPFDPPHEASRTTDIKTPVANTPFITDVSLLKNIKEDCIVARAALLP